VSRAALLVHAISHAPEQLLIATDDRLHQSARAGVYPDTYALVLALREQGIPAVVSGSGPTVLALASPTTLAAAIEHAPAGWIATRLAVAPRGAVVVPR
jgi:homoserine kinase